MDQIRIAGIECRVRIGISEQERLQPQRLLIDAVLFLDLSPAASSDDLARTVDYHALTLEIRQKLEKNEFKLLETAAESVCRWILQHQPVQQVKARLRKFPQQLIGRAAFVEVDITRGRISSQ